MQANTFAINGIDDDTIRELTAEEVELVGGGMSSDTGYAVSVGAAVGLFAVGAAMAVIPGGVAGTAAMWSLGASILSSGAAIHYATRTD